jgi:hypothetical protein
MFTVVAVLAGSAIFGAGAGGLGMRKTIDRQR